LLRTAAVLRVTIYRPLYSVNGSPSEITEVEIYGLCAQRPPILDSRLSHIYRTSISTRLRYRVGWAWPQPSRSVAWRGVANR